MRPEIRVLPPGTAKKNENRRYDYRHGIEYATSVPRGYQPREGGPALLFATDARMNILVNLALASSPVRPAWLWKHMGRRSHLALYPLIENGLVASWKVKGATYIALDPCHPAAREVGEMLLVIARMYGFTRMSFDPDSVKTVTPMRASRRRDVRYTFGDQIRTMSLLIVHVLDGTTAVAIDRCVPYLEASTVRSTLAMYQAFGLLQSRRIVEGKKRGFMFSFNEKHPLTAYVRAVLDALDRAMPLWRSAAVRQRTAPVPRKIDGREGRRKNGRWKW